MQKGYKTPAKNRGIPHFVIKICLAQLLYHAKQKKKRGFAKFAFVFAILFSFIQKNNILYRKIPDRVGDFYVLSVIFSLDLKIGLGMCANGANVGGVLANHDMTAISALPDHLAIAGEYDAALNICKEL